MKEFNVEFGKTVSSILTKPPSPVVERKIKKGKFLNYDYNARMIP
jgi:hypothetical protein